jgi:UPF0755 protein
VRKRQGRLKMLGRGILTLAAVAAVFCGWVIWTYSGPGPRPAAGQATTVMLAHGASVGAIARDLAKAGVIRSSQVFQAAARLTGAAPKLKAGEYEFPAGASMASVLADIRAGRVVRHTVSVPEGWTSEMAAAAVARAPELAGTATAPAEGAILPDTYFVQRGEQRPVVLARMTQARDKLLAQLWAGRPPGLPFADPEQAVTLASIVEKETALPQERPRIAAVFINRLRAGMRLESDPTIIYGITKGRPLGRGITQAELARPTPYNTYLIDGLPPTPIANPGRASLAAVLDPPASTELFFVANGKGGHVFASTFAEHKANVAKWRAYERGEHR